MHKGHQPLSWHIALINREAEARRIKWREEQRRWNERRLATMAAFHPTPILERLRKTAEQITARQWIH